MRPPQYLLHTKPIKQDKKEQQTYVGLLDDPFKGPKMYSLNCIQENTFERL